MSQKINLLDETIEAIHKYGSSPSSVRWCSSDYGDTYFTWEEFKKLANFRYEKEITSEFDYGNLNYSISLNLVVVCDNMYLYRNSTVYGDEYWSTCTLNGSFTSKFDQKPAKKFVPNTLLKTKAK